MNKNLSEVVVVNIRDFQLRIKLQEEVIEDHSKTMGHRFSHNHVREEDRRLFRNTKSILVTFFERRKEDSTEFLRYS